MYERRTEHLLSRAKFFRRLGRHAGASFGLIAGSLSIGILGYHFLEDLPWIDALLNASMILGGMGPVDPVKTVPGKLFASGYALYSGFVALVAAGIIFAPIFHRFLHKFHLQQGEGAASRSHSRNS